MMKLKMKYRKSKNGEKKIERKNIKNNEIKKEI